MSLENDTQLNKINCIVQVGKNEFNTICLIKDYLKQLIKLRYN